MRPTDAPDEAGAKLPYAEPERLAVIWEIGTENHVVEVSHRNHVDWRAQVKSFQDIAAFGSVNWASD